MDVTHLKRSVFKRLKKSKLIFVTHEWLMGWRDVVVEKRHHSPGNRKPESRISVEKRAIRQYWHCGLFHYYRYGLQYKNLTEEELLNYVPTFYHHLKLEKDHANIDTVKYGDKLVQARLFADRNIPSPKVFGVIRKEVCCDFVSNKQISVYELVKNYFENGGSRLFFKPTGGDGGNGILVLKPNDNLNVFVASLCFGITYIIQENAIQCSQLSSINKSSVNTLRVVVQDEKGSMRIKTCILRMGRNGKEVDNSAQGGLSVKVDIETGRLAKYATAEHGSGVFDAHPDTGVYFEDFAIEKWTNVKMEIENIAQKLIDFKNIALDIALLESGPSLLEFNFRYGIEHQQCVLGGVRRLLGIYPSKRTCIL